MTSPTPGISTPRFPNATWDKAAPLAAGVVLVIAGFALYVGPSWFLATYHLLIDGGIACCWLLSAWGWGWPVVRALAGRAVPSQPTSLRGVTTIAVGLGLLSLLVLAAGLLGWLNRSTGIGFLAIGWGVAITRFALSRAAAPPSAAAADHPPVGLLRWLWLVPALSLAAALPATLAPPGTLWKSDTWPSEPHGYDVVEYHLQVPREWFEAGRIVPLEHNVFSYFPFAVEMHYLLAMHLMGGPWAAMYLAQMMHLVFMALAAAAIYGLAAQRSGSSALLALAAAAGVPWLGLLAPIAYNEGGLLLWGTLAVGWAWRATFRRPAGGLRIFILAGLLGGLACGAKLTAGPMILAPAAAVCAAAAMLARRETLADERFRLLVGIVVMGVCSLLVFSPWMIRNRAWCGNALFPEGTVLLGQAHFDSVQVARWQHAHKAPEAQRSVSARLAALFREGPLDARYGYTLVPLALVAALLSRREADTQALVGLLVLMAFFWLGLTHLQSRFLLPMLPFCALLVAKLSSPDRRPEDADNFLPEPTSPPEGLMRQGSSATSPVAQVWAGAAIAVVGVGMLGLNFHARLYHTFYKQLGSGRLVDGLALDDLQTWLTPVAVQKVPADTPLALIGDAKAFWYQRPMRLLRYRTVFDVHAAGGKDALNAWLSPEEKAAASMLVDPAELRRFRQTYLAVPTLPPEVENAREPYLLQSRQPPPNGR